MANTADQINQAVLDYALDTGKTIEQLQLELIERGLIALGRLEA